MRAWLPSSAVCLVVIAHAASARADVAVEGEVTASATVGVTDNIAATPTPSVDCPPADGVTLPAGEACPDADGFGTISPAASLILETAGATQTLGYAFTYTFYFAHPEANTVGNSLTYGLRAPVSERTTLLLALSGSQTNVATFNLATASAATTVAGSTGGDGLLFTFAASQGIDHEVSPTVSLAEAAGVQYGQTLIEEGEDTKTILGTFTIGLTKTFERDTFGGAFATDMEVTPETTLADATVTPLAIGVLHRAEGTWTHQLHPDWATALGAGLVVGYDAAEVTAPVAHPTGHASITFTDPNGSVSLSYVHAAQPNVLLREITLNDTATLTGLYMFGASGFDLSGSGGFTATRSFLSADGIGPPGYAVLADGAVGWVPGESAFRVEARYQFTRQFASEPDATGAVVIPDLSRHAGLLTFTFGWPSSPEAGGAAPFVSLPPPTVSPDFLAKQAPATDRATDQAEKEERDKRKKEIEDRGGSGTK